MGSGLGEWVTWWQESGSACGGDPDCATLNLLVGQDVLGLALEERK